MVAHNPFRLNVLDSLSLFYCPSAKFTCNSAEYACWIQQLASAAPESGVAM